MNNQRRKALKALRLQLEAVHAALSNFDLEQIASDLTDLRDEEQESFDNMPEGLQQGDRGQASSDAIDQLEGAISHLETVQEALQELENAVGAIETAEG